MKTVVKKRSSDIEAYHLMHIVPMTRMERMTQTAMTPTNTTEVATNSNNQNIMLAVLFRRYYYNFVKMRNVS